MLTSKGRHNLLLSRDYDRQYILDNHKIVQDVLSSTTNNEFGNHEYKKNSILPNSPTYGQTVRKKLAKNNLMKRLNSKTSLLSDVLDLNLNSPNEYSTRQIDESDDHHELDSVKSVFDNASVLSNQSRAIGITDNSHPIHYEPTTDLFGYNSTFEDEDNNSIYILDHQKPKAKLDLSLPNAAHQHIMKTVSSKHLNHIHSFASISLNSKNYKKNLFDPNSSFYTTSSSINTSPNISRTNSWTMEFSRPSKVSTPNSVTRTSSFLSNGLLSNIFHDDDEDDDHLQDIIESSDAADAAARRPVIPTASVNLHNLPLVLDALPRMKQQNLNQSVATVTAVPTTTTRQTRPILNIIDNAINLLTFSPSPEPEFKTPAPYRPLQLPDVFSRHELLLPTASSFDPLHPMGPMGEGKKRDRIASEVNKLMRQPTEKNQILRQILTDTCYPLDVNKQQQQEGPPPPQSSLTTTHSSVTTLPHISKSLDDKDLGPDSSSRRRNLSYLGSLNKKTQSFLRLLKRSFSPHSEDVPHDNSQAVLPSSSSSTEGIPNRWTDSNKQQKMKKKQKGLQSRSAHEIIVHRIQQQQQGRGRGDSDSDEGETEAVVPYQSSPPSLGGKGGEDDVPLKHLPVENLGSSRLHTILDPIRPPHEVRLSGRPPSLYPLHAPSEGSQYVFQHSTNSFVMANEVNYSQYKEHRRGVSVPSLDHPSVRHQQAILSCTSGEGAIPVVYPLDLSSASLRQPIVPLDEIESDSEPGNDLAERVEDQALAADEGGEELEESSLLHRNHDVIDEEGVHRSLMKEEEADGPLVEDAVSSEQASLLERHQSIAAPLVQPLVSSTVQPNKDQTEVTPTASLFDRPFVAKDNVMPLFRPVRPIPDPMLSVSYQDEDRDDFSRFEQEQQHASSVRLKGGVVEDRHHLNPFLVPGPVMTMDEEETSPRWRRRTPCSVEGGGSVEGGWSVSNSVYSKQNREMNARYELWKKLHARYTGDDESQFYMQERISKYLDEGGKEEAGIMDLYMKEVEDW